MDIYLNAVLIVLGIVLTAVVMGGIAWSFTPRTVKAPNGEYLIRPVTTGVAMLVVWGERVFVHLSEITAIPAHRYFADNLTFAERVSRRVSQSFMHVAEQLDTMRWAHLSHSLGELSYDEFDEIERVHGTGAVEHMMDLHEGVYDIPEPLDEPICPVREGHHEPLPDWERRLNAMNDPGYYDRVLNGINEGVNDAIQSTAPTAYLNGPLLHVEADDLDRWATDNPHTRKEN